MALPVVESTQTATATSVTTVTITKPTGLAVGDRMLAFIGTTDGTGHSLNTPAGWTSLAQLSVTDTFRRFAAFTKIADSGDVAASNFEFVADTTVDSIMGSLSRISDAPVVQDTDAQANGASSVTMSFTGSSTPLITQSLFVAGFYAWNGSGDATIGSYTSTPSKTWTEVTDFFLNFGTTDPVIAVASAPANNLDTITAWGATLSISKVNHGGILVCITGSNSVTADVSQLNTTPGIFGPTVTQVNTALEVSHNAIPPVINGVNTRATAPTQWQNGDKPTDTNWTNPPK